MNNLSLLCRQLKKNFNPKHKDPTRPVRAWSEKDRLNDKEIDAFVMIFRTQGCSWALKSGCSMCGYFNDSLFQKITDEDLLTQFQTMMNRYSSEKLVKIFTSGSFLDEKEISKNVRGKIFTKLLETAEKVSVESRPEYVTEEALKEIKELFKDKNFEVGIGLETADDEIREKHLNKGFSFNQYKKAVKLLKKYGFKVKTYVLIKPPFISERDSITDALKTVEEIKDMTDIVSFNPTNIQRNTVVDYLFKRRQYRSPWLFSVVEILKHAKKTAPDLYIKCDISGGGSIRGAHNCKSCDKFYLDAISKFSLTQDLKYLERLGCSCKDKWFDQLDFEDISFGSLIDVK